MSSPTPAYLVHYFSGDLQRRADLAMDSLAHCRLCPWQCGVNRLAGQLGQCRTGAQARVYSYIPHLGEEKPLRGTRGSGTIFFSGCNLHCQFCQNSDISQENYGMPVDSPHLASMMFELQQRGCHNLNLVSPTHVVPQILQALLAAVQQGLRLPLVYNSGGFDTLEILNWLDGLVDIYLPDMKYSNPAIAQKYSLAEDYPQVNRDAVKEMHRQVGDLQLNSDGVATRGLLVRHLLLPDGLAGTNAILQFLAKEISMNTYVNIMDQYRPDYNARDYPELMRLVTRDEYQQARQVAQNLGLNRLE